MMKERRGRKQHGGIPAGRAAEKQAGKADKRRQQEIGKLAEWLALGRLVDRGSRKVVAGLIRIKSGPILNTLKKQADGLGLKWRVLVAESKKPAAYKRFRRLLFHVSTARRFFEADEVLRNEAIRFAEWLGLAEKDFLEKVAAVVWGPREQISVGLRRAAEKHGVNLIGLIEAWENADAEKWRRILARPNALGDAALEQALKADDEEFKAEIEKWHDAHPEWPKPDKILSEWDIVENEWRSASPGKTPKPGEVLRWQEARQRKVDGERAAMARRLKAREFAAVDRDITPPVPLDDELAAAFQFFQEIPWSKRERWPTIEDARMSTGMSQRELRLILKGGLRSSRNVWRGAVCTRAKGGRPAERISPVGLQRIIRAFLKKGKLPKKQADQARELLVFLGREVLRQAQKQS